MDEKTLTALQGSIAKWVAILAGTGKDDGATNCPLCQLFDPHNEVWAKRCKGCPVSEKTGITGCSLTPYEQLEELGWDGFEYNNDLVWSGTIKTEDQKALAQAELDFLRSLLPSEEAA